MGTASSEPQSAAANHKRYKRYINVICHHDQFMGHGVQRAQHINLNVINAAALTHEEPLHRSKMVYIHLVYSGG